MVQGGFWTNGVQKLQILAGLPRSDAQVTLLILLPRCCKKLLRQFGHCQLSNVPYMFGIAGGDSFRPKAHNFRPYKVGATQHVRRRGGS